VAKVSKPVVEASLGLRSFKDFWKRLMGVRPTGSRPDAITKRRMRRGLNEYKLGEFSRGSPDPLSLHNRTLLDHVAGKG
jgi:hypothetical protein